MQPLTLMLYSHLDISSERWEVQQRVAVARGDLNLSGSGCGRQFMMTEAAFGRVEAKYMERLADLWNSPEQWTTIPPQCLTAQFRALLKSLGETGSSSGAASGSPPQAVSLCCASAPGDSGRSQQHDGHHP